MLQRWVDPEEQEHRVRDDFERNKILIDPYTTTDEKKKKKKSVGNVLQKQKNKMPNSKWVYIL